MVSANQQITNFFSSDRISKAGQRSSLPKLRQSSASSPATKDRTRHPTGTTTREIRELFSVAPSKKRRTSTASFVALDDEGNDIVGARHEARLGSAQLPSSPFTPTEASANSILETPLNKCVLSQVHRRVPSPDIISNVHHVSSYIPSSDTRPPDLFLEDVESSQLEERYLPSPASPDAVPPSQPQEVFIASLSPLRAGAKRKMGSDLEGDQGATLVDAAADIPPRDASLSSSPIRGGSIESLFAPKLELSGHSPGDDSSPSFIPLRVSSPFSDKPEEEEEMPPAGTPGVAFEEEHSQLSCPASQESSCVGPQTCHYGSLGSELPSSPGVSFYATKSSVSRSPGDLASHSVPGAVEDFMEMFRDGSSYPESFPASLRY